MNQCEICHKCWPTPRGLMVHYRIHTGGRPHNCDICGKTFRGKSDLAKHCYGLHGDKYSQSSMNVESCENVVPCKQVVATDVKNLHKCEVCDHTFSTVTKMQNHLRWHKMRKRYKCNVCGNCFKHPVTFKKHQQGHKDAQKGCEYTLQPCNNDQQPDGNTLQQCNSALLPCDNMVQLCGDNSQQCDSTLRTDDHSLQQPETMVDVKQRPHPVKIEEANEKAVQQENFCETCKREFSCNFSYQRHVNELHMGMKRARKISSIGDNTSSTSDHEKDAYPKSSKTKEFTCLVCYKTFANAASRAVHVQRIHPSKIFKCDVCVKAYGVMRDLRYHYKNSHNVDLPFGCEICGKHFRHRNKLREHYAVHGGDEQEKSRVGKPKGKKLRQPRKSVPPRRRSSQGSAGPSKAIPEKQWECNKCGKRFQFPSRLNTHMILHEQQKPTTPNSEWPYQCDICENLYRYPSRLRGHYQTKHQLDVPSPQPYWCKIKAEMHKCSVCSRTFPFKWLLKKHQLTHENQARPKRGRRPGRPGLKKGTYTCDVCRKKFKYPSQLNVHYVSHKKKGKVETTEGSDQEPMTSTQTAASGKGPTLKPYSCNFCHRSFLKTNHLKQHCRAQHNTDKPFRCGICALSFDRVTDYKIHRHTFHAEEDEKPDWLSPEEIAADRELFTEIKSRQAEISWERPEASDTDKTCKSEKKSHDKRGLDGLCEVASSAGKSASKVHHSCDICGARFGSYGNLTMHLDIHFDRRPYSCRFCPMKFRQPGHLMSHCKNVHGQAFPYRCDYCKMQFKGQVKMAKHLEDVHGVTGAQEDTQEVLEDDVPIQNCIDFEQSRYTKVVNSKQSTYACKFCDSSARTYKSLSGLRRHITVIHKAGGSQPVYEDYHPQGSTVTFDLQRMVTMAREGNPIKMTISEEIFKCNVCSVIVHGADALEAHEQAHLKAKSPNSISPVTFALAPTPSIPRKFECKFCGQEFDSSSREAFDKHELEHEFAAEEPIGTAYICVECDKEFSMANDLVKHYDETH